MLLRLLSLVLVAAAFAQADAPPARPSSAVTQTMTLSDAQVQSFLDALDELRALGDASAGRADASRPAAFAEALHVSGASRAILDKHGFADVTQFQRVAYNASMAYGVLKRGGKQAVRGDLDEASAQQEVALEKMKQHMSPDQIALLRNQMAGALKTAETTQDVPEQNLEAVRRHRDRFAALGKR